MKSSVGTDVAFEDLTFLQAGHAMEWNRMENGMERKENFGMEYGRCSE